MESRTENTMANRNRSAAVTELAEAMGRCTPRGRAASLSCLSWQAAAIAEVCGIVPAFRDWEVVSVGEWRIRGDATIRPVVVRVAWTESHFDGDCDVLRSDWDGAPVFTVWERSSGGYFPSARWAAGYQ